MPCSVLFVSALQQCESFVNMHIFPPLDTPSDPPPSHASRLSQGIGLSSLCYATTSHYFTHGNVYVSMVLSQFIPSSRSFPPLCPKSVLYFASVFLPCKQVHQYHFSRFHMYALIYDICFSLSDFTLYNRLQVHSPH